MKSQIILQNILYQSANAVFNKVKGYIDKLAQFKGAKQGDWDIGTADMQTKIQRCKDRADQSEAMFSDKEFKRKIQRIDKNRARTRYVLADGEWGHRQSYSLIIDTSKWEISELAKSVADFVKRYFKDE
jgi:cytidylate kinase